jgi:PAS domain-containing protein
MTGWLITMTKQALRQFWISNLQDIIDMSPPKPVLSGELLALLESLPEPRILVDPDYRILSANAAYRHTFGNPARTSSAGPVTRSRITSTSRAINAVNLVRVRPR